MTQTPPNPATVFANRKIETQVVADLTPSDHVKIVRPGRITGHHDGVVKAKHLKPGQTVRAFLHGEARGGERTVGTVKRIEDGAFVEVEWSSGHPTATYKAAYRWYDEKLAGKTISKPALVDYQEV